MASSRRQKLLPWHPKDNYTYMFIPINQIPQEIINHYNLHNIVHKGKVYVEIRRSMYGLPQAGILAEKQLIHFLGNYGYSPVPHTPGLWCHQWRPITFCLVIDNFGIKYVGREHANHLIQCLRNHYKEIDIDWAGKCFCGTHLNWDYTNRTCNLSMPGYVDHALHKFQHPTPKKLQDSPYPATVKQYGVKVQLTDPIDTSARLPPHEIKRLQQIIGTFLFYGHAVDPTLLTALSELSSSQATATNATKCACKQFLDYCASHPDGSICYQASNMILKLHSDSSYLNAVGARSRQGGHLYLGNKSEPDILNGAVLNLAAIIKMVISSAAEAEFGALFHNTKEATPLRTTIEELGHPQPPTPILVDTSTAVASPTTPSPNDDPVPSTCASIGSGIASTNSSTTCTGPQHTTTLRITSPSITHPPTTAKCANTSSTQLLAQSSFRLRPHDVLRGLVNPNRDSLTVIRR